MTKQTNATNPSLKTTIPQYHITTTTTAPVNQETLPEINKQMEINEINNQQNITPKATSAVTRREEPRGNNSDTLPTEFPDFQIPEDPFPPLSNSRNPRKRALTAGSTGSDESTTKADAEPFPDWVPHVGTKGNHFAPIFTRGPTITTGDYTAAVAGSRPAHTNNIIPPMTLIEENETMRTTITQNPNPPPQPNRTRNQREHGQRTERDGTKPEQETDERTTPPPNREQQETNPQKPTPPPPPSQTT